MRDNLTALRWVFTGIGLVDLLAWRILVAVGQPGAQDCIGGTGDRCHGGCLGRVVGGVAGLAGRLRLAWFRSVEDLVFTGGMSASMSGRSSS